MPAVTRAASLGDPTPTPAQQLSTKAGLWKARPETGPRPSRNGFGDPGVKNDVAQTGATGRVQQRVRAGDCGAG